MTASVLLFAWYLFIARRTRDVAGLFQATSVVSTGVRLFVLLASLSLCVAACGQAPSSAPSTSPASSVSVNPARIEGVRTQLPSGYEVAALRERAAPVAFWGLGTGWTADPPRC